MGKVQFIRASRKAWVCQKCNAAINKGDSYYRGEVNFGPTFIRCNKCKLQPWEVTSSDYQREAGRIINTWDQEYSLDESGIEELVSALSSIGDDLEERLDNMPENLQESPNAELLRERMDAVESAISDLECIDFEDLMNEAVEEVWEGPDDDEGEDDEDPTYYDLLDDPDVDDYIKSRLVEVFEDKVRDAVGDALDQMEY